jgi:hypothetical protein
MSRLESLKSDKLLVLARVAESSERYDDMVLMINTFVKHETQDLNIKERYLSVAYKIVVSCRRHGELLRAQGSKPQPTWNKARAETYKPETEILQLVDSHLLPLAASHKGKVSSTK